MAKPHTPCYFYILRCKDATLYCGITKDTRARQKLHNSGRGSKYVKAHGGGTIVYRKLYPSLARAMEREREVKKWEKTKKENLIKPPRKQPLRKKP